MKYVKIMIIIVIFVFAMSVSCAADTNNASISEDNSQMLLSLKNEITDDTSENSILAQTNNDETLSAQKDSEILRANEGNYSDLRYDIFNNGGNLKKSYYRYQQGDGDTIEIKNSITINGNGAVIDMNGSNIRAFNVTGSGVTFKNLTIKNANFDGSGGAIYFSKDGTVSNCNFTGNNATLDGGAVYFNNQGNVSNCNFTGNTATGEGGAVYFAYSTNPSTLRNCNFTDNHATNGGAIRMDSGSVTNCNFTGNNATVDGGAIYTYFGTVSNCNFTGNTVTYSGGAVYFLNNGDVRNCNFTDNKATGSKSWGGAVYFLNNGDVRNCNFTGNNATGDGGAIWMVSGTVSNCNFTANTATGDGGAVYWRGDNGVLSGSNFNGNNANGDMSGGGAVYWTGNNGNLTGSNFNGNNASSGGAVSWYGAGGVLSGSNFTGNTATYLGGAVYFYVDGDVRNCNFTGNTVTHLGGAVYFVGTGDVRNCNFTGNNATGDGGAVFFAYSTYPSTVRNCNFTGNTATGNGGAVNFLQTGTVLNCNFTGNTATNGGAIKFTDPISNSNINSTFISNKAELNGGAIYFEGMVSNSNIVGTYINNKAEKYGGANYFNNKVSSISKISGNYNNNNAKQNGGANYFNGAVVNAIIDGVYENNKANGQNFIDADGGGANYFKEGVSNSTVSGTYTNNTAENDGGANYFNKDVSGSTVAGTYTNNKAENNGGANFFNKDVSGSTVAGTYTNNKAENNGGANSFLSVSGLTVNGTYTNNKALYGGANDFGTVSDSTVNGTYTNNTAERNGGANNFDGAVSGSTVTGTYTNNTAENNGGANFFNKDVSGSTVAGTYTNNKAENNGGANSFLSVSGLTVNGTYTNNKALYGGANDFGTVSDSTVNGTYTNNTAERNGGANNFDGAVSGSTVTGTYTNNTAERNGGANNFAISVSISIGGIYINNTATDSAIIYFMGHGTLVGNAEITNAIFLNNNCKYEIYVNPRVTPPEVVVKDSWFGNNASNYMNQPKINDKVQINNWLFLNATAEHNSLLVMDSTNITFKLNSTNGTDIFEFDNSKLPVVNLTLTASNGDVDKTTQLDKTVKYKATSKGTGTVTAKIENAQYTIYFDNNLRNVDLSVSAENITYLENEILTLTYNNTATGKVNITLNSTKYNKKIEADINHTITIADLPLGEYNVTVEYFGDNVFSNATSYANFIVEKMPTEVIVDNKTMDLFVDDEFKITYTLNPDYAVGNITFSSDDSSIVGVDSVSGDIQAKAEGTAIITVTFGGSENYTASSTNITVTVSKIPTEINITNETVELKALKNISGLATLNPKRAGNLTYTSNDENIVVASDDGIIYARIKGTAIVTVSFAGDDKYKAAESKNITVTVTLNDARVSVENDTLDLFVDDTYIINATSNPSFLTVYYTSSDESVATVTDYGNVKAVGEGTAIITLTVGNNETYAINYTDVKVTVSKVPTEITVNPASLDLFVGDETVIIANLTPRDAGNVTFTSGDESIVDVDGEGNVIAQGKGTAIITVSFAGDNKYAAAENKTIKVTVSLNDARVTVDNNTLDLKIDETYAIKATKYPDTIMLDITYKSSDESVASVDKNGIVTAISEGTAIITLEVGDGEIYAKNSTTVTVTVKKVNPTMDASADEITEGENATINVELPIDATGNVTTTVNDKTYFSPVDNGKAIITIPGLEYGNYTLPVTYSGDDKYNSLTNDVNLTVKEDEIVVSAPDLTKYYSGHERFTVNVFYANGRAIAGKEVKITINGVTYKRTTDVNGSASLSINLNSATYDTVVEVDNISVNSIVTILPTIEAEDVESKSKNIVFSATFVDGEGNYLKEGTDVSFNIGGVIYNSQVTGDKGLASVDLVLNHGRFIITSYNSVSNENVSNSIAVDLKDADMILSSDEISVGDNATISVTLPNDATGNVTATINGKTYTSQVNNGKTNIIIPGLTAGNYTAHVTYSGDNNYNHATGNVSISVSKMDPIIDIEDDIITVGENATVIVILPGDATGDVRIGNEIVHLKEGSASAILTDLPVGITTIPVTYSGDGKYNPIETSADVVVNEKPAPEKANLTIEASADEITEGEDAVIVVTGLENATGNVSAVVHGHIHSAPIVDGTARITVSGLAENATASVSYAGDDIYNPAVTHVNITVNKNVTAVISAENLTKYYKDSEKFTIKITDAKGQPAANKTVEIIINGVTYKRTTDENGTASLSINLNSGVYPVRVVVDGVEANFTVTVQSTIDSSDIVKIFRNGTQYNAIFTDANGTLLPNIKVSFNLHGIIYNRTTDKNGAAKLNINLDAGEYIITAFNSATGEMKSNTIKVISLIESDDLTKYFRNASQFVVRIHSADGGYVGAGEEVSFNINGVIYTRLTNATGHAKLNINLHQGNYTITTYYKDCGRGNTIEVLPILTADDLSMKYMDGSQFKAQLVDGKGNPYPKQTVTFNINGVFYNRLTDNGGIAKLNIRLMAGQYIITSSYNGCNISNKITIWG